MTRRSRPALFPLLTGFVYVFVGVWYLAEAFEPRRPTVTAVPDEPPPAEPEPPAAD